MIDMVLCFSGFNKIYYKKRAEAPALTFKNTKKNIDAYIIHAKSLTDGQKPEIALPAIRCMKAKNFHSLKVACGYACAHA